MDTAAAGQALGNALSAGINAIARYLANLDVLKIGAAFLNVAIVAAQGAVLAVQGIELGAMTAGYSHDGSGRGCGIGRECARWLCGLKWRGCSRACSGFYRSGGSCGRY